MSKASKSTDLTSAIQASPEAVTTERWRLLGPPIAFRAPQANTSRIHGFMGKGGMGKTALTIMVASRTARAGRPLEVFDLDSSNPSIKRYLKLDDNRIRGSLDKDRIGEVIRDDIYPLLEKGSSVACDLGGSAEIAFLDFIEEAGISELLGEQLVMHVPIGPLDSIGTAMTIAERGPYNPVIVYVNHKESEVRMLVRDPQRRALLDSLLAMPNILGVIEIPQMSSALTICSRISKPPHLAALSDELTPIERAMCASAMNRIEATLDPIDAWLP